MITRDFLSRTEAVRLAGVLAVAETEGTQTMAAERIGMKRTTMAAFLHRTTGSGAWPPDIAELRRLLALKVLPDDEAHARWCGPKPVRNKSFTPERKALRDILDPAHAGPSLPDEQILARRDARATERAAHEARWLAAERERWGQTRQTLARPLSRMPA